MSRYASKHLRDGCGTRQDVIDFSDQYVIVL